MNAIRIMLIAASLWAGMTSCSSPPAQGERKQASSATVLKKGGYYLDDGPAANPPADLDTVPDAIPRAEPLHRYANRTYSALGNTYTPDSALKGYREEGLASWYGKRFHGKKTASGEPYDMYGMTAAHRTLPIPSYARVTAIDRGHSVVVRINDRGPFSKGRVIDVSYTAAHKLGILRKGSLRVRVESIDPSKYDVGGAPLPSGIYLQLGAFDDPQNARRLVEKIQATPDLNPDASAQVVLTGKWHRVALGPYRSHTHADTDSGRLRQQWGMTPATRLR